MKIRTRLAIRFTIIVASLLIIFALAIYYFSSTYRQEEFYERLDEKAYNYTQLLVKIDTLHDGLLDMIDKNTIYLYDERILLYNNKNELLFSTREENPVDVSPEFLDRVRHEKEIRYMDGRKEALAVLYATSKGPVVVLVSAYDKYGLDKLQYLEIILLISLSLCIVITMIAGWIYAGQALSPISGVIAEVEEISASNLARRVSEGNGKDEIASMAITFNHMLERIQHSFELQKSFVSNSSHELRTPLTSITGQIEVALMSQKDIAEYKAVLSSILEDIKSLNHLTNGLFELAHADMDISRFRMGKVRLDELLWQTRHDLLKRKPSYKILIDTTGFPEEEATLTILGNEHLIRSLLINLMDNACKFSPNKQVKVFFTFSERHVNISFEDEGIGISEEDLEKVSQPFHRGSNTKGIPGHGLGLSLCFKIAAIHRAEMKVDSRLDQFTRVTIRFPLFGVARTV
jgi:signal transduction histidine kinase